MSGEMKGYDLIHDVVAQMSEVAPPIRRELTVRALTSDGGIFDIVRVTYDKATDTVWLRVAEDDE